ncbi:Sulfate adenylyltransferase subunit 1 [Pseudoalteromonas carrageenovora]|uniref:Sulfate adenylyltransferase subunit 1 n=1 Tax=Pseudoalteromonas carrageenovora IAM 12662 TaxID=1314868 RepID=A0A2K4X630_PSEVC|nr:sulfate adenylyltransferase subunit CysN [Pseudoalteromonas carrageenovora]MBE0381957.1 sulfate adenylyltransferase subunit 1 [Pseudoalteromonas carrageenovora IAM 12662]QBJ70700.1 Sulfate adenylyltransferase subunit 1 [Pseudoalteromonas carrageenovora]GEB69744.1 sulfate adenylyltransferase subunit 1 [Pseudoalteromonas carrageenovora]SOU39764.1 ATP-sulfurylase, subunit 1 [Pseudoalteromonas carrageenovora IAM 12662]
MTEQAQTNLLATDIEAYLKVHENKDMLRILTCGSVDDGKSTLIGRLLYDSKMIFEDQMAAIEKDSKRFNTTDNDFDLALLVDGLQSEREQGITIDVAYRYFATDQRKFIIADTPGHEQYTRNMATGASTCDLAIILIDARHGVQVQTRRHSFICSLLGIKNVVVAINKMDAVGYEQSVYQNIKKDYREFAQDLKFDDVRFVPISALRGDNVVNESEAMSWYPGSTLMKLLNTVQVNHAKNDEFRLQVQYVNRPNLNFRGFSGTVAAGGIRVGDTVASLPSGKESKVKSIVTFDGDLEKASAGMAITLTLEDEIDVSRGDMLVRPHQKPHSADSFVADVVWMTEQALNVDREYEIKVGSKSVYGYAEAINYKVDVNTLKQQDASQLNLNEIGNCQFALTAPVQFDAYDINKHTGAFIIIDRLTNVTVGAGMIRKPLDGENSKPKSEHSAFEIEFNALVRKHYPHWDAKVIR